VQNVSRVNFLRLKCDASVFNFNTYTFHVHKQRTNAFQAGFFFLGLLGGVTNAYTFEGIIEIRAVRRSGLAYTLGGKILTAILRPGGSPAAALFKRVALGFASAINNTDNGIHTHTRARAVDD